MLQQEIALTILCLVCSHQQDKYQPIQKDMTINVKIDWIKILIVALILVGAIISNFLYDMPALGVWIAIVIGAFSGQVPWKEVPGANQRNYFSSLPCHLRVDDAC